MIEAARKNKSMLRSSVGFDLRTACFMFSKQAITDKHQNDVQEVSSKM